MVEIYSGPKNPIFFKLANIFKVTFVTMMYGVGLPILYPIAFLSYFIFWVSERHQIAYFYQMPPAMKNEISRNAMDIFSYLPILYIANGAWMLSNRQIFDNILN
jgi:hypothetical protein